ncbi:type II toxin-antitoxin system VapB family antitoxin [Candidatus Aerophobetes bacterium]|nr:type II toxin-antitoxin system VapB family antitoxin [Candidatus Aerophobetes bacterium]
MRTTIDIDEKILNDVVKITGEKSKTKAINKALQEYIQKIKIKELLELSGKMRVKDTWRNLREMEVNEG